MSENKDETNETNTTKSLGFGFIPLLFVMALGILVALYMMDFAYTNLEKETTEGEHQVGSIVKFFNMERGNEFKKEKLETYNEVWELKHITSSFLSSPEYYYERTK